MTESDYEQQVVRLLQEIANVLHSVDTALTDVVAVIEENTDKVTGAADAAADRVVAALVLLAR